MSKYFITFHHIADFNRYLVSNFLGNIFYRFNLTYPQKIAILAIFTGIASGLAGIFLKFSASGIYTFLTRNFKSTILMVLLPVTGILISRFLLRITMGSRPLLGLSGVLFSIARKSGIFPRRAIWVNPITSAITAGFGGSAGLEGPVVATSAAVGSTIANRYRLGYQDRILLISAGTAAGIASVFNAPIAGVMFAIEVLLPELTVSNFIPLMFAAASGALCSHIILHDNILINFTMKESFSYMNVPHYLLLGFLCGFFSIYYIRSTGYIESFLENEKYRKFGLIIAMIMLSFLCYIFPALRGEGLVALKALAAGDPIGIVNTPFMNISRHGIYLIVFALICIAFLKPLTAVITIKGGGNGGNFGPSLLVGGLMGYAYSRLISLITSNHLPESNFTIVAMAGMLSGIMQSPLTAIFLIAEISGGYGLFIPLLIVSSLSYLTTRQWEPHSVDTRLLALKNNLLTHDTDKNALLQMNISNLIEWDVATIRPEQNLENLVTKIRKSRRNIFAVLGKKGIFLGIVYLDDIKNIIFDHKLRKKVKVFEVMKNTPSYIQKTDSIENILDKFEKSGSWNLPVLDKDKYYGFISKSRIFNEYRNKITRK